MRNHFTTFVWFGDRLSSLSSAWLLLLSVLSLGGLAEGMTGLAQFLDDLVFLVSDNDLKTAILLLGLLLLLSTALWLLSCSLGALARKAILYIRGL